jgi:predicted O-methyltransferase YrrM
MPASKAARMQSALTRIVAHPKWTLEGLRRVRDQRREEGADFSLERYREYLASEEEAVAHVLGAAADDYRSARDGLWLPEPEAGDETHWSSRVVLLRTIGVVVRLLRPATMVETGVERGYSAAVAMAAMERNGRGRLYSVDLPRLDVDNEFTGRVIPEHLRDRWTLEVGPSRFVLPDLVKRLGQIDLFLHDSDHTYAAQMHEYRTVWPVLRRGGVLVSDDVWNTAFMDFAREVGAEPRLIQRAGASDAVGLLRKG